MAAYTYAGLLTQLFKIVYDPAQVRSLVAENFKLKELFTKFEQPPVTGGQYWEFAVESQWASSAGSMAFNGTTRTPQVGAWVNGRVYQRQRHATYQIEYAGMQLSKSDPQAFLRIMEAARDNIVKRIRDTEIKQYLGGNSGTLAVVNGAYGPAMAAVPVHGMLNYFLGNGVSIPQGAEIFRVGDQIVFDPDGTPQYRTVTGVNKAAGTIAVNANVTVTDDMAICYGEAGTNMDYLNSMDGFSDLFAAGDAYENIDPATVPVWDPQVFTGDTAGTLEPLSSKHINRLLVEPQINAGAEIDVICGHSAQIQSFMDMYEQQIRYAPGEYKGGMRILEWELMGQKVKFVFDPQFPHHTLFGLPTKECLRFVGREGKWLDEDGAELKWVPNTTQFIAVWVALDNFGTRCRNKFAIQQDIEEPWA